MRDVGIWSVGTAVPDRVLTNEDLEKIVDTTDEWIRERTGIRERRIAADEATSDLAGLAATRALGGCGLAPEDVDLIIVGTASPDTVFPSTACRTSALIGAGTIPCVDLLAACASFHYGLHIAWGLIAAGGAERILVIGSEVLSKFVDWEDRATCVLFGDGAGAVIIGPVEKGYGIRSSVLGADGTKGDILCVPAGGSLSPATTETVGRRDHYIKMNGREVFRSAVVAMEDASRRALEHADVRIDDVDLFIPHQANSRIIVAVGERLGIPTDRIFSNIDRYGNTSAASIPIALADAMAQGRLEDGDVILTTSVGGGLTWGAAVIVWGGMRS